jgi:tetratricopeptide (TPR) repeat protein
MPAHTKKGPVDIGPSKQLLSGPLTEAGRVTAEYSAVWGDVPLADATEAAKPTHSRARRAREEAARGERFLRDGKHTLAVQWLSRSVKLDPNVAATQYELGVACFAVGQLQEAIAALRRAISIDPQLGNAHIKLAGVLDILGRETEAQEAYERGLQLVPSDYRTWARLAEIHLTNARRQDAAQAFLAAADAADPPQAEFYTACAAFVGQQRAEAASRLRALIADYPDHTDAHLLLGQVLAENGQFEEAATSIERGVALNPGMVAALSKLVSIRRIGADDRALMERMNAGLERRDLMPRERQAIHFALGKGYDDLGDYAAAIRHFDAANKIRGARTKFDRPRWADHLAAIIASASPGFLELQHRSDIADATPILIVGMPRSGTTLVEQILSSHPDVAAGGELTFWGDRHLAGIDTFSAAVDPGMIHNLADDYLAVLRAISPHAARVTDKMPFNFLLLGLIREVFPHATIVHCRRHPIDTCLSIFVTDLETGYEFAADRSDLVFIYRSYLRLMDHWRSVLPSAHFIEVDYEALVADPERSIPPLVAACGLDWNDACLTPHQNARRIATASLWQARQPIYRTSVKRWRRYEPWLGELRELLEDTQGTAAYSED